MTRLLITQLFVRKYTGPQTSYQMLGVLLLIQLTITTFRMLRHAAEEPSGHELGSLAVDADDELDGSGFLRPSDSSQALVLHDPSASELLPSDASSSSLHRRGAGAGAFPLPMAGPEFVNDPGIGIGIGLQGLGMDDDDGSVAGYRVVDGRSVC